MPTVVCAVPDWSPCLSTALTFSVHSRPLSDSNGRRPIRICPDWASMTNRCATGGSAGSDQSDRSALICWTQQSPISAYSICSDVPATTCATNVPFCAAPAATLSATNSDCLKPTGWPSEKISTRSLCSVRSAGRPPSTAEMRRGKMSWKEGIFRMMAEQRSKSRKSWPKREQ